MRLKNTITIHKLMILNDIISSGPGGRRFKSSLPDHSAVFSLFCNQVKRRSVSRIKTYSVNGAVQKYRLEHLALLEWVCA